METINHESYVSLDVAKLLKKAGFDWKVISYYRNGNDRIHFGEEPIDWNRQHSQLTIANDYSAPTLEVAQRWLREVKNIDVFVLFEHFDPKINGYTYEIRHKGTRIILSEWVNTTYEGALEAGIKKALEIILEK
jgi:hypothetical protein